MSAAPAASRVRSARPPAWAFVCFILSGAGGLLFEIVWSKQVSYLLGSSLHSVAAVTAAFLGGLALGARLLGARLTRSGDPGRTYAVLEAAIALLGLAVLPALHALSGPVGVAYRALGGEGAAFAVARLAFLFLVLMPPAMLMGATLPVLVARIERGGLGAGLAGLYALNTFGAVAGSWLAGFVLMPRYGLLATSAAAAVLDLTAAAIAWRFASGQAATAIPAPPAQPLLPTPARRMLAAVFAVSGFAALALQLAWVRLFGLVLGSSVYSFAGVLGVYLAGLAVGSLLIAPVLSRVRSGGVFGLLQAGIALAALAGLQRVPQLPGDMLALGERMGTAWSALLFAQLGLVFPIVFPACVLLGAAFPVATRLLQEEADGPAAGAAYALNTIGTLSGALLTGWVLLPALGVRGVVSLAAVLAAVAAVVASVLPGTGRPRSLAALVTALLLVLSGWAWTVRPPWDPVLMSLGTYRPFHARNLLTSFRNAGGVGDPAREVAAAQRVLLYRDGINASVLVATDESGGRLWMRVGGKIDAGTGDMLTQVLLGAAPAAMAKPGVRTLIVGLGSGATVRAALDMGVGPTDVVELEPAVVEGSHLFHAKGRDPLDDPRVTLTLEDARTRLAHGAGRYGIIISQPTNPWIAGVNNLFTREFYQLVRRRLEPDGVFAQWLQLYELSPESFRSMLAAFESEFPEAHLFCLWQNSDLLFLAAPPGRTLDLTRFTSAGGRQTLAAARLSSAAELAAFAVPWSPARRALAVGATANTDDRPYVEYRAARDLVEVGRSGRDPALSALLELPYPVRSDSLPVLASWPPDSIMVWRGREWLRRATPAELPYVWQGLQAAGAERWIPLLRSEREATDRAVLREASYQQAVARLAAGDHPAARAAFETWVASGGGTPEGWLDLARLRREAGDRAGAADAAQRAMAGASDAVRLEAVLLAGQCEQDQGHATAALRWYAEAQRLSAADPRGYDFEARVRYLLRDLAGARAAVERGLTAAPTAPSLLEAKRALSQLSSAPR